MENCVQISTIQCYWFHVYVSNILRNTQDFPTITVIVDLPAVVCFCQAWGLSGLLIVRSSKCQVWQLSGIMGVRPGLVSVGFYECIWWLSGKLGVSGVISVWFGEYLAWSIKCLLSVLGAVHLWHQPLWGEGGGQPNSDINVINERPLIWCSNCQVPWGSKMDSGKCQVQCKFGLLTGM